MIRISNKEYENRERNLTQKFNKKRMTLKKSYSGLKAFIMPKTESKTNNKLVYVIVLDKVK